MTSAQNWDALLDELHLPVAAVSGAMLGDIVMLSTAKEAREGAVLTNPKLRPNLGGIRGWPARMG